MLFILISSRSGVENWLNWKEKYIAIIGLEIKLILDARSIFSMNAFYNSTINTYSHFNAFIVKINCILRYSTLFKKLFNRGLGRSKNKLEFFGEKSFREQWTQNNWACCEKGPKRAKFVFIYFVGINYIEKVFIREKLSVCEDFSIKYS